MSRRCRAGRGEVDHKLRAARLVGSTANSPAHAFGQVFDNRQPKAGSPQLARSTRVEAVEALKDALAVLQGNARAVVGDNQHNAHAFFERLGDSVVTGPTRTNVNDFRALLIQAP